MSDDVLARLLTEMWTAQFGSADPDAFGDEATWQANWLRSHRDRLLAALGACRVEPNARPAVLARAGDQGRAWIFAEDDE